MSKSLKTSPLPEISDSTEEERRAFDQYVCAYLVQDCTRNDSIKYAKIILMERRKIFGIK